MDRFCIPNLSTMTWTWRTDWKLFVACTSTSVFQRYWFPSPGVVPSHAALTLLFCLCAYCLLIIKRQSHQGLTSTARNVNHFTITASWHFIGVIVMFYCFNLCGNASSRGSCAAQHFPPCSRVPNAWEETRDDVNCTTNGPAKEQKTFSAAHTWGWSRGEVIGTEPQDVKLNLCSTELKGDWRAVHRNRQKHSWIENFLDSGYILQFLFPSRSPKLLLTKFAWLCVLCDLNLRLFDLIEFLSVCLRLHDDFIYPSMWNCKL